MIQLGFSEGRGLYNDELLTEVSTESLQIVPLPELQIDFNHISTGLVSSSQYNDRIRKKGILKYWSFYMKSPCPSERLFNKTYNFEIHFSQRVIIFSISELKYSVFSEEMESENPFLT